MIKLRLLGAMCAFVAFTSFNASAATVQLSGTGFPAPGGTTFIGTGDSGVGTGQTWSLSNFDNTQYDKLYYVVGDYPSGFFDPSGTRLGVGTQDLLSFDASASNFTGGIVAWTGNTTFDVFSGGATPNATTYDARFTLSILVAPVLVDASTITGMPNSVGAAYEVTGDFQANWLFELELTTGNWVAAKTAFNNLDTVSSDVFEMHAGGAFYYSPVPVPATVWLFGSGLLGLVGVLPLAAP